ncbi:SIR2 family NAD-dependent protein deacylase [Sphingobacterium corticibacter]|uniref:NAD-dependent protein deacylase n=1 Tax=Sphingobacterium corticibacter TaxID=2171749 RepID=A0A2T8HP99_9SPHI|nr:NAD-dependent deacylase [Sphingobacterium corticibacter]PVH27112.1 NAD-dependent protein deacylase [Sphingobacterium corticibacter]
MRKIVVFTGAGISAESGLQTFRGADGLWEGYRIEDVATPEAWHRDPDMVQHFYNLRRKACLAAKPNTAHQYLADLAKIEDVQIITQNIDDLHERAGSDRVLHLHGQITKSQSSIDPFAVYPIVGDTLTMEDRCERGAPLRPHVVWFGEAVPAMDEATTIAEEADVFIVIGTSLQVYPAANLLYHLKSDCKLIFVDPNASQYTVPAQTILIEETAVNSVPILQKWLAK